MAFLKNTWYLAAWSGELAGQVPLARTVAGEPLVLFRDAQGSVTALLDRCPHRFAPLSRGVVRADGIQCGYHGLVFGTSGQCIANPHGAVLSALKVPAFPVVERHAAVWVWLGAPQLKDETAIADLSFIDATPEPARVTGYLHVQACYQLMTDNIMDLTHADYLHPDTLGGGINTRAKARVEEGTDGVTVRWEAKAERVPPLMSVRLERPDTLCDFLNEVRWSAPGVMRQRVLFGPSGRLAEAGHDSWNAHVMIPETEGATHYFFCHTSDHVTANPTVAPMARAALMQAFQGEDAPMIEAQQRQLRGRSFEAMRPMLLPTDAAAVAVRRRMQRLLEAETPAPT